MAGDLRRVVGAAFDQRAPLRRTTHGFALADAGGQLDQFEPEEITFVLKHLADVDVFVDIGANVGLYTCLARHRGVRTVAVEPSEVNLRLLFRSLRGNGFDDVMVLPVALGARIGTAELYGSGTGASLIPGWAGVRTHRSTTVPMVRADDLVLPQIDGRRALVKLDVEGAEAAVLAGARSLLRSEPRPVWLIEVDAGQHHPGGAHPDLHAPFREFWDAGYVVRQLSDGVAVTQELVTSWADRGVQGPRGHSFTCMKEH